MRTILLRERLKAELVSLETSIHTNTNDTPPLLFVSNSTFLFLSFIHLFSSSFM
jgi:hypothetical protein